jgi:hypothetical protein
MAKMPLASYPVNEDFIEFSKKKQGLDFLTLPRDPDEGCMCNEQSTDLYPIEGRAANFGD